jgi:hypothetical protein
MHPTRAARLLSVLIAAIALAAIALPATAGAGVPQKNYACYGEGSIYISTLKIKSATAYNYLGKNGKYKYHPDSKVLSFKSGPLDPWVGHLYKSGGKPAILLTTDRHGGQKVNCYS